MLHTPHGAVDPEWKELADRVTLGDGLGWPGDPRLWLALGVLRDQFGRERARRLEVWRWNEDGSRTLIGHWLPEEQFRILFDLGRMRVEAPGHVDMVAQIEAHNDAHEAELSRQHQDKMADAYEHAARLFVGTSGEAYPIHHQVGGTRDKDVPEPKPGLGGVR